MPRWPLLAVAVGLLLALGACGEPDVDLDVPERQADQKVLDEAGILDGSVQEALEAFSDEWDVVAVAYETPQASAGEASRAGRDVLDAWGADVALVAVARPGDFTSTDDQTRRRFFGVQADAFEVAGSLREAVAEEVVPPLATDNDWTGAFRAAADHLRANLEQAGARAPGGRVAGRVDR